MAKSETVEFEGQKFRRYPDSENRSDRFYFKSHGWGGDPRYLHVSIYEHHHGPVAPGFHVHHEDGDPLNNDPANLATISASDHCRHHFDERRSDPEFMARVRANLDRIRPLAAAWHRSPEGRAWHSDHAKQSYALRVAVEFYCDQCGDPFESTKRGDVRFCTNKCKTAYRYWSGVDNEQRECGWCGDGFTVNKYLKTRCCSNTCAQRLRRSAG